MHTHNMFTCEHFQTPHKIATREHERVYYQNSSAPEPKARGHGDGFVEFVQRTFVERETKGSKVVTRSQSAEITAYLRLNAIAQSVHLPCINQLTS